MEFEYEGTIYKIGDKIEFNYKLDKDRGIPAQKCIAEIFFKKYSDGERYEIDDHLGVVVRFNCVRNDWHNIEETIVCEWTFPDFINIIK
jgi:hypothetical protein